MRLRKSGCLVVGVELLRSDGGVGMWDVDKQSACGRSVARIDFEEWSVAGDERCLSRSPRRCLCTKQMLWPGERFERFAVSDMLHCSN